MVFIGACQMQKLVFVQVLTGKCRHGRPSQISSPQNKQTHRETQRNKQDQASNSKQLMCLGETRSHANNR